MMPMFLVFLKNATDGGEFVAPVAAADRKGAVAAVTARYPEPVYTQLTCYEESELRRILDDAQRWPGVASTVQPPLADVMRQKTDNRTAAMARLSETRGGRMPVQASTPSAAAPARAPQDLKSALAALKQVGGLPTSGGVTRTAEAPVAPAAPISRHPQPVSAGPVISRHPEQEPVIASSKSVIEVFRGLRR